MNTISYTDFSGKIHSNTSGKRIPLDASVDLTYRCNNKCVHCYCNLPDNDAEAKKEELSTDEIKKLLDDLASLGTLWLLITGGEPLLREDFEEIYLYAKKKGFLITLFTNGTLVNDRTVELLSKYPPFVVEISLYGATEETYEKVTRAKGSYDRCIAGIRKTVKAGIKLKLKTMALTVNQHEVEAMDTIARELGCEFRFDPIIQKRIDNNIFSDPVKFRIVPEEVVRLDMMFPKRMKEWRKFCDKFIGAPMRNRKLYKCGAGLGIIHITPYGNAKGCMTMRDGFSIRNYELRYIWDEGIYSEVNQEKGYSIPCDACNLLNLCDQCAPWSILEHDDIKKPVEYLCSITAMRRKRFDFLNLQKEEGYEEEVDIPSL